MSEPVRLRSDPDAPSELKKLVGGSPLSRPMSRALRARSSARVDRLAVVPAAAGVLLWLKGVAIAASVGLGGVAIVLGAAAVLRPVPTTPSKASVPTHVDVRPAAPLPQAPTVKEAMPASSVPTTSRVDSPVAPARAAPLPTGSAEVQEDRLAREAAMLEDARRSLDADPRGALATLDRHRALFSGGVLAPERELLAVEALHRLGRTDEARHRAEELLAGASGSLYEERVRKILKGL